MREFGSFKIIISAYVLCGDTKFGTYLILNRSTILAVYSIRFSKLIQYLKVGKLCTHTLPRY